MLLDANNPPVDSKPAQSPVQSPAQCPDRPARADSQPDRDPPATNDPSADAAPTPAKNVVGATDAHCGKTHTGGGDADADAADDATDAGTAATDNTDTPDQSAAESTDAGVQIATALIVTAPAIAPAPPVVDAAPAQTEISSSDAIAAPIAAAPTTPHPLDTALDGTTPAPPATEPQTAAEGQSVSQSTDADNPEQAAQTTAPVVAARLANPPAPAVSAAPAAATDTESSANIDAPVETDSNVAPATPVTTTAAATTTEPAKKTAPVAAVAVAPAAGTSAPVTATTAAAAPAATKPTLKTASTEAGASTDSKAPPQAKPQADAASAPTESADTNAAPVVIAANGTPTKNDGAKSEGDAADGHTHRATAEHASGIDSKPETSNQIADTAAIKIRTDSAPALNSTVQAPQVIAPTQTIIGPAIASVAAIPLSALPVEIAARAKDGINRFEIRLDPPELGRIDVRLDIDRSGHVTSRLMVERPETLDLLRRDAPQIERALQDAGLKTSDQGMQFSLRDQTFADQDNSLPAATNIVLPQDDIVPLEAMRQGYGRLFGLGGGIDIRV